MNLIDLREATQKNNNLSVSALFVRDVDLQMGITLLSALLLQCKIKT